MRRIRGPADWWIHLSLVAATVQMPFYGMMPHVVIVGATAGLAHRSRQADPERTDPRLVGARRRTPSNRSRRPLPQVTA